MGESLLDKLAHIKIVGGSPVPDSRAVCQSAGPYLRVVLGSLHQLPPDPLHGLVPLALHGQLSVDVLGGEDGLQVEPRPLTLDPLIQHILRRLQFVLPAADAVLERLLVWREGHRLCHYNVIVEELRRLFRGSDHVCSGVLVRLDFQSDILPLLLHLVQSLLNGVLLTGNFRDLGDGRHVIVQFHLQTLAEGKVGLRSHRESNVIRQLLAKKRISCNDSPNKYS